MTTYTEADFDGLSWHDCSIWGLEFRVGDFEDDDALSDLALDIDFIVDWVCGVGTRPQFRVAPASLVFHGVTSLRISLADMHSDYQTALYPLQIRRIERRPVADQKVYLDRRYDAWTIHLNTPSPGEIHFGAVAFTQRLRADPVLIESQRLSFSGRRRGRS